LLQASTLRRQRAENLVAGAYRAGAGIHQWIITDGQAFVAGRLCKMTREQLDVSLKDSGNRRLNQDRFSN
jgi:hypothetical protein